MASNEAAAVAQYESVWLDANRYYDAERRHYEVSPAKAHRANPGHMQANPVVPNGLSQSSLASEIAYARQKIQNFLKSGETKVDSNLSSILNRLDRLEKGHETMKSQMAKLASDMANVVSKLSGIEQFLAASKFTANIQLPPKENKRENVQNGAPSANNKEDDDLDLFGSDEEDTAAAKLREERLQAYSAKKAKKPALVAKSSVVLDVKPWDDETDMKEMEKAVRAIGCEGLVWGASKFVPLAYGIKKLQIVAVVEDEKVSIDWLQETICDIEELVQSVDVAAFNKL